MRILTVESEPFHVQPCFSGPETSGPEVQLPFHRVIVDQLPPPLSAIVATSDLQGVVKCGRSVVALGEAVATEIGRLQTARVLPARDCIGCLLAGDLHPYADERDVTAVWLAMSLVCRWVVGVAGNHDVFGTPRQSSTTAAERAFVSNAITHVLDGQTVEIDGLTIGGVGGIVGKNGFWTRSEAEFAAAIVHLARRRVDLLLSHDGPTILGSNLPGWPSVRQALETAPPTLLIRGHDAWPSPLATLANGTQVLNVEGRVAVLVAHDQPRSGEKK